MRNMMTLAAVLALAGNGSALAATKFTPATGPTCKDESTPELGSWTCPGPAGYAVRFADEGNIVSFTIAPARVMNKSEPTAQWRGAGKVFGDKVQWIMRAGVPRAAVIRTWRRPEGNDEGEVQELSVFAIDGARACPYAAIEIHAEKANDTALARAEQAAESRCPEK